MTLAVVEVRAGCTAQRHDTPTAYKKNGCRCPEARRAETARKAKYDTGRNRTRGQAAAQATSMLSLVKGGVPPFHADDRRACANLRDPDLMFSERESHVEKAKAICRLCPFQQECAAWALEHRQLYGVWGAVDAAERRRQIIALHRPAVTA
jgi:hypothetical protein